MTGILFFSENSITSFSIPACLIPSPISNNGLFDSLRFFSIDKTASLKVFFGIFTFSKTSFSNSVSKISLLQIFDDISITTGPFLPELAK